MSSMQVNNGPSVILPQASVSKPPQQETQTATPKAEAKKDAWDTFDQTLIGAGTGAQTVALVGGLGAGISTYASLAKDGAPAFHKVLLSGLAGGGGAAAGVVVGGLSGAVAGAFAETKTGGAAVGAGTGAVTGAVAAGAIMLKSGKGFDVKTLAAAAVVGAGLGAVGGFASRYFNE